MLSKERLVKAGDVGELLGTILIFGSLSQILIGEPAVGTFLGAAVGGKRLADKETRRRQKK